VNDTTRTQSINRTVAVVVRYAIDLEHAIDVLMAEFGFDRTFLALAAIEDPEPIVHRAMWVALAAGADLTAGELADGDLSVAESAAADADAPRD
jgi:hypothetical protein